MTATRVRGSAYMAESSTLGTAGSTSASMVSHPKPILSTAPAEDVPAPVSSRKRISELSLQPEILTEPSQRLDLTVGSRMLRLRLKLKSRQVCYHPVRLQALQPEYTMAAQTPLVDGHLYQRTTMMPRIGNSTISLKSPNPNVSLVSERVQCSTHIISVDSMTK
jgi:hypothetical protein